MTYEIRITILFQYWILGTSERWFTLMLHILINVHHCGDAKWVELTILPRIVAINADFRRAVLSSLIDNSCILAWLAVRTDYKQKWCRLLRVLQPSSTMSQYQSWWGDGTPYHVCRRHILYGLLHYTTRQLRVYT